MKTLDDVIRDMKDACDHLSAKLISEETWNDALRWLEGYRGHIELDKIRDKCEEKNDPLTMEEIIQLPEGTPLWVEGGTAHSPEWCLYKGRHMTLLEFVQGTQNDFAEVPCDHIQVIDDIGCRFVLDRERQGKMWNVYRYKRDRL